MKPLIQRIDHIQRAVEETKKNPHAPTSPVNWQGKKQYFPIITIDLDYLMFRIENTRTTRQQLEFLDRNLALDKDFFKDPESSQVQDAQRTILLNLIDESVLGVEFLEDLKESQDEPAIITHEGYIVNGNRRVAALGRLGKQYADCVVLPVTASKKELYALEQELQISQDFKDEYHWINELLNFKRGLTDTSLGDTENQMADRLRIRPAALKTKLRMMDLVDKFLDWKKQPGKYNDPKLDTVEEAFRQIEKLSARISNSFQRDEFCKAIFVLIENPPSQGRLYSHINDVFKNWLELYRRMAKNTKPSAPKKEKAKNNNSLLDQIAEVNNEYSKPLFDEPQKSEGLRESLMDTLLDIKAENRDQQDKDAAYSGISAALREIQPIVILENSSNLEGAKNKLEEIRDKAVSLLKEVNRRLK